MPEEMLKLEWTNNSRRFTNSLELLQLADWHPFYNELILPLDCPLIAEQILSISGVEIIQKLESNLLILKAIVTKSVRTAIYGNVVGDVCLRNSI